MNSLVKGRNFIVGSPRSGTTLLQSLIATQAQVASFPETHFFGLPGIRRSDFWLLKMGIAPIAMRSRMIDQLDRLLRVMGRSDLRFVLQTEGPFMNAYVRAFVDILDNLAVADGKDTWVEKTPSHLYFIDVIERYVPDAKFIHISRSAPDMVASLFEVTHQHPELWGGAYDIDRCIERWYRDRKLSCRHLQKKNHFAVTYEDIVMETETTLAAVGDFMGFDFDRDRIAEHRQVANKFILDFESWKDSTRDEICNLNREKFDRIFDRDQKDYILRRLDELGARLDDSAVLRGNQ